MPFSPRTKKILSAVAVGVTVFALVAGLRMTRWFEVVELKAFDHLVRRYADPAKADSNLVLLAIDESSLEAFGRWPWPRDRYGYVVRYLKRAGAKAVVFDVMFFEPDDNAEEFDQSFADDVKAAGNVFLPMLFQSEPASIPAELPAQAMVKAERSGTGQVPAEPHAGAKLPIPVLAQQARGLGAINLSADADGPTRRLPLLGQVNGNLVPHLSVAVARYALGGGDLAMRDGRLQIGNSSVPLDAAGNLLIAWHGSLEQTYHARKYSIGRVLHAFAQQEKGERPDLDASVFKDKIVFIAGTAAGLYDLRVTPFSSATPGVLIHMAAGGVGLLLRLRHRVQRQRGLARRFRPVDLDHAALGQAADAQRDVQAERAGGDDLDVLDHLAFAQPHDRALAELLLDLRQCRLQGLGFFGVEGFDGCVHGAIS